MMALRYDAQVSNKASQQEDKGNTMNKVITFTFEKSTKGTHRFTEDSEDGNIAIGTLYLKKQFVKETFGSEDPPAKIAVAVSLPSLEE